MRQAFTEEEMNKLRQSPYVKHVSPHLITYGSFFEYQYHLLKQSGLPTKQCFEQLGLDPETIGEGRMKSFNRRYLERVKNQEIQEPEGKEIPPNREQYVLELEKRNRLLEQELEFVKKKIVLRHKYNQEKDSNNTTSD
tara:strand:+ start:190 stop:603 length:414 start_codon:yes stop_codon:yes gene_type:complete